MKKYLFIVLLVGVWSCESSQKLNVSLAYSRGVFHIINDDDFTWEDCECKINNEWSIKKTFKPKNKYEIYTSKFTKDSGERFNSNTHRVNKMNIKCKILDGRIGYWDVIW